MILLVMLMVFGPVGDALSIRFIETSGSTVWLADGRRRDITNYDEEPWREPDTTWVVNTDTIWMMNDDGTVEVELYRTDGNSSLTYFHEEQNPYFPYWNDGDRTMGYYDDNHEWVRITEPPTWWEDNAYYVIVGLFILFSMEMVILVWKGKI